MPTFNTIKNVIFYLLVCVAIILVILGFYYKYYIERDSIVINGKLDTKILSQKIKTIALIKAAIYPTVSKFCGKFMSHWGLLLNDSVIVSTSKYGSVYVYFKNTTKNVIKHGMNHGMNHEMNHMTKNVFKTSSSKWHVCKYFTPIENIKISDIINFCESLASNIQYSIFDKNCQYIISMCLKHYTLNDVSTPLTGIDLGTTVINEYFTNSKL